MKKRGIKKIIKVNVDEYVEREIIKRANIFNHSVSHVTYGLILNGLLSDEVKKGFTQEELMYFEEKRMERNADVIKYLRRRSAEKIFFIKNIKHQIYLYAIHRKDIDLNDVLLNMEFNLRIARINKWTEAEQKIKVFMDSIKNNLLEGRNNETDDVQKINTAVSDLRTLGFQNEDTIK